MGLVFVDLLFMESSIAVSVMIKQHARVRFRREGLPHSKQGEEGAVGLTSRYTSTPEEMS